MISRSILALTAASVLLAGCDYVAEHAAPHKQAATTRTELAIKADALFWSTLHGGEYAQIPTVLEALTAAYVRDPTDAVTAAHIGFAHIWRLSERHAPRLFHAAQCNQGVA